MCHTAAPPHPTAREIASLATMKLNYGGALNISLEPVESEDIMEDILVYDDDRRRCLGAAGTYIKCFCCSRSVVWML